MSTANPVEFRPYEQSFAADPYPVYAELRQRSPVFYSSELGMTLFTCYDDIRGLLLDSRLGRSLDLLGKPDEDLRRERDEALRARVSRTASR